jgi:hypothetical protein
MFFSRPGPHFKIVSNSHVSFLTYRRTEGFVNVAMGWVHRVLGGSSCWSGDLSIEY